MHKLMGLIYVTMSVDGLHFCCMLYEPHIGAIMVFISLCNITPNTTMNAMVLRNAFESHACARLLVFICYQDPIVVAVVVVNVRFVCRVLRGC